MNEDIRNGAPYQLIATFPEQKKDSLVYTFADADSLIEGIGTLALVHIKENIRKGNGRRTVFEVIPAPEEKPPVLTQVVKIDEEVTGGGSGD